mgnify:CR=1 FL=1
MRSTGPSAAHAIVAAISAVRTSAAAGTVSTQPSARAAGKVATGVILTGMGRDGLQGSRMIVEAGGSVIAQDEFTSVVWGMPGEIVRAGLADAILPLPQIGVEVALRLKRRGV